MRRLINSSRVTNVRYITKKTSSVRRTREIEKREFGDLLSNRPMKRLVFLVGI